MTPSIRVILGTGGTIAGRATSMADNVGYVSGAVSVGDLLAAVPPFADLALEAEQIAQVDSKDMGFAIWQRLALRVAHHLERDDVQGVVVTHGTDTLEETAWFLQAVLQPRKPVVMTCAMRPATALVPDGPQNLLDAVAVAGVQGVAGVLVVCAGQVHLARHVAKVHSYRVDAFDSGEAGPVACVEEGAVRWLGELPSLAAGAVVHRASLARVLSVGALPLVTVVTSHADADGLLVDGLLMLGERDPSRRVQGIVVAATGNGSIHAALEHALLRAQAAGVKVVRSTRCARGRVVPGTRSPFPDSAGLSPVKARITLALDLMSLVTR